MDSVHVFDYIEIDGTIYGVRADTYDQSYRVNQRWWSMMKLFKPSIFKKKKFPFYSGENKKLFVKYIKTAKGKPSKNFTSGEINAIKSIFMTNGSIVVMKNVSDALYNFFKLEFGFSLNDCKKSIFEIDANTLENVDPSKEPFLNNQIYKALQEAAYGDGIGWAEEVMELTGFEDRSNESTIDNSRNNINKGSNRSNSKNNNDDDNDNNDDNKNINRNNIIIGS